MVIVKAAMREKFARHEGSSYLIRMNAVPCYYRAVLMLKETVIGCLKIDKLADVFGGKSAYDVRIFVHACAHTVGAARLHKIRSCKEQPKYLIACAFDHLAQIMLVFVGSACLARNSRNIKLSPYIIYSDADADIVRLE